jgi:hypothetical protein
MGFGIFLGDLIYVGFSFLALGCSLVASSNGWVRLKKSRGEEENAIN